MQQDPAFQLGEAFHQLEELSEDLRRITINSVKIFADVAATVLNQVRPFSVARRIAGDDDRGLVQWLECKIETIEGMSQYVSDDARQQVELRLSVYRELLEKFRSEQPGAASTDPLERRRIPIRTR